MVFSYVVKLGIKLLSFKIPMNKWVWVSRFSFRKMKPSRCHILEPTSISEHFLHTLIKPHTISLKIWKTQISYKDLMFFLLCFLFFFTFYIKTPKRHFVMSCYKNRRLRFPAFQWNFLKVFCRSTLVDIIFFVKRYAYPFSLYFYTANSCLI